MVRKQVDVHYTKCGWDKKNTFCMDTCISKRQP